MRGLSGSPVVTVRTPAFFWELFFFVFLEALKLSPKLSPLPLLGEYQMARSQVCQLDGSAQ